MLRGHLEQFLADTHGRVRARQAAAWAEDVLAAL